MHITCNWKYEEHSECPCMRDQKHVIPPKMELRPQDTLQRWGKPLKTANYDHYDQP